MDYEALKREVIERFASNEALREQLSMTRIEWQAPVVGIQDILLDERPSEHCRTIEGARLLTEEEYSLVLKNWEKNFIGGTEKLSDDCKMRTWFPPKGSQLFRLQRIENVGDFKAFEFFLLQHHGRDYFLKRLAGARNSLRVLNEKEEAFFFDGALRNVLLWKPNKEAC